MTDLYSELIAFISGGGQGVKALRLVFQGFGFGKKRTNGGMGAYKRALVALYAVFFNPFGNVDRDTPSFIFCSAGGNAAVGVKLGYGQSVAFLKQNGVDKFLEIFVVRLADKVGALGGGPFLRNVDFL